MSLQDFKRTLARSGTEFQVLRAERLLPQLAGDALAYDVLGGLADEEGANAVADVIELAAQVAPPGGRINATHIRAAIREKFAGTDKARQTLLELGRMSWPDLSQRRG